MESIAIFWKYSAPPPGEDQSDYPRVVPIRQIEDASIEPQFVATAERVGEAECKMVM